MDAVEQMLTLLPVPDLCRYRTVCRQWNELISNPHFAALHAQNHANPQDATFVVLRYVRSRRPRRRNQNTVFECGWCILDLNAKRWYNIKDSNPHKFHRPDIMAMDGGLVAQFSGTKLSENLLIVHNPIGNEAQTLPAAPHFATCDAYPALSFMVDPISQSFKAFLINHDHKKTASLNDPSRSEQERACIRNDPLVRVYDSVSRVWESLVNPNWDTTVIHPLRSIAMLQSRLFLLFGAHLYANPHYALWVYNLVEQNWLDLAATMDIADSFYNPKLVMTADRLFLVAWSLDPPAFFDLSATWYFEVQEIDMVQMVRKPPVLRLSDGDVESRFGIRSAWEKFPEMVVIGIRNASLMVMAKSSGKCGVFDVMRGCWEEEVPENPLGQLPEGEERVWAGKNMKLLLPHESK